MLATQFYTSFMARDKIQDIVRKDRMSMFVVNIASEEVVQWINWRDTAN